MSQRIPYNSASSQITVFAQTWHLLVVLFYLSPLLTISGYFVFKKQILWKGVQWLQKRRRAKL